MKHCIETWPISMALSPVTERICCSKDGSRPNHSPDRSLWNNYILCNNREYKRNLFICGGVLQFVLAKWNLLNKKHNKKHFGKVLNTLKLKFQIVVLLPRQTFKPSTLFVFCVYFCDFCWIYIKPECTLSGLTMLRTMVVMKRRLHTQITTRIGRYRKG